jgi:MFS family permease
MQVGSRESLAPLRERSFRLMWLAHSTSVIGDQIAPIAVAFAVLDLTGSPSDLGLALAARTLPMVLFVLIGGVWADRMARNRLMLASDLGRFATQGLLALLLLAGAAEIWHVFVLQALNGAATAFYRPAATGLTPSTVSAENLPRANALLAFTNSGAQVLGPVIAGVLVATVGPGWGLAADAGTFALSALFLSRIVLAHRVMAAGTATFLADLRGGWDAVRSRTWLWLIIVLFAVFQILVLATFFVLGPVVADRELGGAAAWAAIMTAWGVGAVAGAVVGLRVDPERPLVACNLIILLVVPPMVLLGVAAPVWIIAVAAAGGGMGMSLAGVIYETAFQRHVPQEVLSRAAAWDWMGSTALRPLGYAAVGPVAVAVGVGVTLQVAGLLTVVLMLGSIAVPAIRLLGRRPE